MCYTKGDVRDHPRNPITVHIARLLANCAVCPIHEAAAELAAYLTKDLT